MANMRVKIAGVELKNPVMTAAGTFGTADEFAEYEDLSLLGGICTKGVAPTAWTGNPTPRVAEITGGMLNCIGLQNPGIDVYIERDVPVLAGLDTVVMANVCGHTIDEYVEVVRRLRDVDTVKLLEINISCPNVAAGGASFGTDPRLAEEVTKRCREVAKQPVIMKLTPNVTSIAEIAKACEAGGADGVSLINTITGMKIDIHRRRFALSNKMGGMGGPAIKPVAVRMVWQTAQAVKIPIIGMGGIMTGEDVAEFIMAGATAVQVGVANFVDPAAASRIAAEIEAFCDAEGIKDINEIRGCVTETL